MMLNWRRKGTVEEINDIEGVEKVSDWIAAIPLEAWPQQNLEELHPAMQVNPEWPGYGISDHNQGEMIAPLVAQVMQDFPGYTASWIMLSTVLPGRNITSHKDEQGPDWRMRVHVPLLTNPDAMIIVDGVEHNLAVGKAYGVNVTKEHSVVNHGSTPRTHLIFDVRGL